jgi:hypothetical protein
MSASLFRRRRTQALPPPAYAGLLSIWILLCLSLAGCSTAVPPRSGHSMSPPQKIEASPQWREFEGYYDDMIARIDASWRRIVESSTVFPHPGTQVLVTFKLTAKGEVNILKIEETAGRLGVQQSITAITQLQPFPAWTPDMISKLGQEQQLTVGFNYD